MRPCLGLGPCEGAAMGADCGFSNWTAGEEEIELAVCWNSERPLIWGSGDALVPGSGLGPNYKVSD